MLRHQKHILITLFSLVFVFTGFYAGYNLIPIVKGPEITLQNLPQDFTAEGTTFDLRGSTKRVTKLYINGSKITINKNGDFETTLAIYKGNNILSVQGFDRFGRQSILTTHIASKAE